MRDIMDLHTHTIASGHAYSTLEEMIRSASEKGVSLLGITEHGPDMQAACDPFYYVNFKAIPRDLWGVKIMMGCELNILDFEGNVDLKPSYLNRLDFAIASLHTPCIESGSAAQNTAALIGAMKNPYIQIIGHPDDSRYPLDYETLVSAAKEHHVLLEVNSSSLKPTATRVNARENYLIMLDLCKKYQVPVIIDSDAHFSTDVANHTHAHALLEELQFPEELIVNSSIEKASEYIPCLKKEIYT